MSKDRASTLVRCTLILVLAGLACSIFAADLSESDVQSSIMNVVKFLTTYVIPGLGVLVIIWGAVDLMQGTPGAVKKIIVAIVGIVIALAAKAIINYVIGAGTVK